MIRRKALARFRGHHRSRLSLHFRRFASQETSQFAVGRHELQRDVVFVLNKTSYDGALARPNGNLPERIVHFRGRVDYRFANCSGGALNRNATEIRAGYSTLSARYMAAHASRLMEDFAPSGGIAGDWRARAGFGNTVNVGDDLPDRFVWPWHGKHLRPWNPKFDNVEESAVRSQYHQSAFVQTGPLASPPILSMAYGTSNSIEFLAAGNRFGITGEGITSAVRILRKERQAAEGDDGRLMSKTQCALRSEFGAVYFPAY